MKKTALYLLMLIVSLPSFAAVKEYRVSSPDGSLTVTVTTGDAIRYSVVKDDVRLINPSEISMTLSDGTVLGADAKMHKMTKASEDRMIETVIYKKDRVRDNYNEITLDFKTFHLIFRAYDDGAAYRFVSNLKTDFTVSAEKADFNFAKDWPAYVSYVNTSARDRHMQFYNSYENTYKHHRISEWEKDRLGFLPQIVEADNGIKVCITESDLLDYPGLYLINEDASTTLKSTHPAYPKEVKQGGHNELQGMIQSREDFIAKAQGHTAFPWRIIVATREDRELLDNDMVYRLASAEDSSTDWGWIRPGKVAWDWWNCWNIRGVDFKAGINNNTYKYYIDFAASKGIEYVILDEGWAVNKKADLYQVVPEIDLEELITYGKERHVGIILWAGYWAVNRDIEGICKHFSEMGVKGFKVDFMDRDDQQMVDFYTTLAETAARYHLLLDFHGAFKPSGLQRTYPNVLNFEAVHGLETMKWTKEVDQVTYDVTIPFTRMLAGPMDYTQGAMRNATKGNYRAVNSEAMSQGTRCRQLAEYVIFEAPLTMLCDSPSNYMAEPECTSFIANTPTIWDETIAIDGKLAEYAIIARRKGSNWYVAAMTDWNEMDYTLDLSFLPEGKYSVEVFRDGKNADRAACDYARDRSTLSNPKSIAIHMAPGGGWIAKFIKL